MNAPVRRRRRIAHALVVALCLAPAAGLAWAAALGDLGANPIETTTHVTGEWTLRFLVLTLAVTPVRRLLRFPALAPYRRTFGLTAFGYACMHFATYVGLDLALELGAVFEDIAERPYIAMGFTGFLLMVPLAATSGRGAKRRLGLAWVKLHRLVYVAAICGVVHFLWLVKADLREPLIYAAVLATLLLARLAYLGSGGGVAALLSGKRGRAT